MAGKSTAFNIITGGQVGHAGQPTPVVSKLLTFLMTTPMGNVWLAGHLNLMHLALCDHGIARQIASMVQQQM